MSSILDALERASQNRPSTELELIPKGYEADTEPRWRIWILWLVILLIRNSIPEVFAKKLQPPDLESQLRKRSAPSERSLISEAELSQTPKQSLLPTRSVSKTVAAEPVSAAKVQQLSPPANQQNLPANPPRQAKERVLQTTPLTTQIESLPQLIEPQKSSPSAELEQVEDKSIPLVWELPQDQREALQQLKVSIHVYHKEPERRFVLINMRRYGEGDQLRGTDYRLKTIERDGVVIDYGAGLVRL
ncbi:MAG: general secretion pathway protein GspB, partial [Candidatus Thiodiazotropha sp.]